MTEKQRFSSRWGTMLVMLGMAVGTGNIWRFPRIAAQNGGGEFLIPWVAFLFLWSIPLLLVEFGMGRKVRAGPVVAFARLDEHVDNAHDTLASAHTDFGYCFFDLLFIYILAVHAPFVRIGHLSDEFGNYFRWFWHDYIPFSEQRSGWVFLKVPGGSHWNVDETISFFVADFFKNHNNELPAVIIRFVKCQKQIINHA